MKMKIRCIYDSSEPCKYEYDEDGLYDHLRAYHASTDRDSYLVWLLFKIHEKIESLEKSSKIQHMLEIEVLKSILAQ